MAQLTTAEQDQLEALIDGAYDRPATWAQNLLCFGYGLCRAPLTGGDPNRAPLTPVALIEPQPAQSATLQIYPNPANERAIITLPKGVGPSVLTVYSPMGAVVDGLAVKDGQPFVELSTRHWTPGIHLCQLRSDGFVIGEVKLNIQH